MARTAVLELIVKYPEKTQWKDTLVRYMYDGNVEQAILLEKIFLKQKQPIPIR